MADYCRTAVRHLAPGGVFACVFPIRPDDQHQRVRDGAQAAGLTILRMRSVVSAGKGTPRLLGLFLMNRADGPCPRAYGSRTWTEPPSGDSLRRRFDSPGVFGGQTESFGFPP